MSEFWNAFISYGRADSKEFATKLHNRLSEAGFNIWFDQNDIPLGVDFQNQIDDGIDKADNFLFLIAPHSINSPYCLKEVLLALKRRKRIIPLLHVEEISKETWQQRNPNGTDEQWEAYKAAGKHSSYPNMHPEIGKINWVYFREGADDFEASFAGLVQLLRRHEDYVHQHTTLLEKALTWDRNQRQSRYLLAGEERNQAIAWLHTQFTGKEQPPCNPTRLHCELIGESIKSANNLLTDVFIATTDEDNEISERLRDALMRDAITLWDPASASTSRHPEKAIEKAIQEATNFIFLLSPQAIASPDCLKQLEYAVSLNKRITAVQIANTAAESQPEIVQHFQAIDLANCESDEAYTAQLSTVLKRLKENSAYFEQHKHLLVRALKWQAQNHNLSLLLRGYNLESADAWLKLSSGYTDEGAPLAIHRDFIEASKNQPPDPSSDVYLCYARADVDFARKLNDALQSQGKQTWFDLELLSATSDANAETQTGIADADNFIFLISRSSVENADCLQDLHYAQSLSKRIVPLLIQTVTPEKIAAEIRDLPTINFADGDDFYVDFNELVRTLDIDREHVQSHTKWLQRAIEWESKASPEDLLLRGTEFTLAEVWQQEAIEYSKTPPVTDLQQRFIGASKAAIEAAAQAERERQEQLFRLQEERAKEAEARLALEKESARKQRLFLFGVSGALAVSVVLAIVAAELGRRARISEQEAIASQIGALSKSSKAVFALDQRLDALVMAIRAQKDVSKLKNPDSLLMQESEQVLRQAVYGVREQNRLNGHSSRVNDVSFAPNGELLASASGDRTIRLWKPDGTEVATLEGHTARVWAVAFSPDSKILASASVDGSVRLWDAETFQQLQVLDGHTDRVLAVTFAPDGKTLASGSADESIKLWDVASGKELTTLKAADSSEVADVAYSRDGKQLFAGEDSGILRVWNLEDNTEARKITASDKAIWGVAVRPDNEQIVTGNGEGELALWNLKTGEEEKRWAASESGIDGLAYSPDGKFIATGSLDGIVKTWSLEGKQLSAWVGHESDVTGISFQSGGTLVASSSRDRTVRIWQQDTQLLNVLSGHTDRVRSIAFSPVGDQFASASWDNTIRVWSKSGEALRTLTGHTNQVYGVAYSSDGSQLASASRDRSIRLWDAKTGEQVAELQGHKDKVNAVAFVDQDRYLVSVSDDQTVGLWDLATKQPVKFLKGHLDEIPAIAADPTSDKFASASDDTTVIVWNTKGEELFTLKGHQAEVLAVAFSPDGKYIATGSVDNTVKLWKADTGEEIATMEGHTAQVNGVTFSADSQQIASASTDDTTRIWDLDGKQLTVLTGHGTAVNAVAFSPDGEEVATGANDGSVILTPIKNILDAGDLLTYGCKWVSDYLRTNRDVPEKERTLCDGVDATADDSSGNATDTSTDAPTEDKSTEEAETEQQSHWFDLRSNLWALLPARSR